MQKAISTSFLGTFQFVMLFIVLLTLIGRLLVLIDYEVDWDASVFLKARRGPTVDSPRIPENAFKLAVHRLRNPGWNNPLSVFVVMTKNREIYLDGKAVAPEWLRDELRKSQTRSDIPYVLYLDADASVPYGEVEQVLKVASSLGFVRYMLVARLYESPR